MLKSEIDMRRSRLGNKLKTCRVAYGIKQKKLLETSGLFSNTISAIECGGNYDINSFITYSLALVILIDKAKRDNPKKFTGQFHIELHTFITQHQYVT